MNRGQQVNVRLSNNELQLVDKLVIMMEEETGIEMDRSKMIRFIINAESIEDAGGTSSGTVLLSTLMAKLRKKTK